MNIAVFEHTVAALRAVIQNENEPLQKISHLIKYDPGLYFSLLRYINSSDKRNDITSVSQAISLIGAEGSERFILEQDYYLDESNLLVWCYSVIAGETAALINERAEVAEEDEAFFAGILPCVGTLLMLETHASYQKILDLILKIPIEQRVFIEEGLYKTNHIIQLDHAIASPKIYKDIISLMSMVFSKEGHRRNNLEHPSKLSVAHKAFQLFRLIDIAETAARTLLFPAVIEAQEKFRELCKMYFKIPESEIEEILAEILERFEEVCREFNVEQLSEQFIARAEGYRSPGITFLTTSATLQKKLEALFAANRENKNILLYGASSVGKRLLAIALHRHPDNPRRAKPFLSVHCACLDSETFEMELFGAKGGFLGLEKHKGVLELANGGTILLKDIDNIPLMLQDKLAEIFSKDEFYKIGETRSASFDIRVMMTSRKNIIEEAKAGRFSLRLLNVLKPVSLHIPPLRERREDIGFIADSILEKYGLDLNDEALRLGLKDYYATQEFSDNLRDLKKLLFFLSAKHRLKS